MSYFGLEITFCDEDNNKFLSLGGAAWESRRERDEKFSVIPASASDTPFIVDVRDDYDIVDDRLIDLGTVEAIMGRSIGELIREARERELST